jgi:magnesium transporter
VRASGSFHPISVPPDAAPWEELKRLIQAEDAAAIWPYLSKLPPAEMVRATSRLTGEEHVSLFSLLDAEHAAELLEILPQAQAADILEELPAEQAAPIVEELPSADQADMLGELTAGEAEAILARMAPSQATSARRLLSYEPDTAGGIMSAEYLAYPDTHTVGQILEDMRTHGEAYSDYEIQYAYITGADARLVGVLRLRDLVLSRAGEPAARIMMRDPLRVTDGTPLEDLQRFFDEHAFLGVPVVDADNHLVGVVQRSAVEGALRSRATRTYLQAAGLIGEEEFRTMPLRTRSLRRLSWLSLNIVLNVIAASVIAIYQETLSAVIALAVFLPIISDMSGCSGSQAVAVSIRELTLGLIRPNEFLRVVIKEGTLGMVNGVVLGVLLGFLAFLWKGNLFLGLVVGSALALNTVVAVLLGGLIPLLLRSLKLDPALASGPILTTVTDMCGFFLVLSSAAMVLPKLAS